MVIILYSFGAIDELGTELPLAAETRAPLNFVDRTDGMSDILWCIFHHAEFHEGYVVVRPVGENRPMFRSVV